MEPLMSEEDIRQYFVQNGGIVKNTDIVNYFRSYLSNPAIRDEARTLFKAYVNKLASIKVENGEKFLILKRQYFLPIDGNSTRQQQPPPPAPSQGYNTNYYPQTQALNSNPGPSFHGGGGNVNYLRRQNSQPQIYGSQYSLSSNYMDPYNNPQYGNINQNNTANFYPASHYMQQQTTKSPPQHPLQNINLQQHQQQSIYGNTTEYPPEYGLPPVINAGGSPRRYVSPQNSYGSNNVGGSPSRAAVPPPYRAPPPAANRFPTSPSNAHGISRRSSMTSVGGVPYHRTHSVPGNGMSSYYSTSSTQNVNALMDPSSPAGMYQYHRSASVTGLPGSENPPDNFSGAPPVPPRSRRSVERSPSAANSYSSSSTSSNINTHVGLRNKLQTKMESGKMNGEVDSNQNMNAIHHQPQNLQNMDSGSTMHEQLRMESNVDNRMIDDEHEEKENMNSAQISDSLNHEENEKQSNNDENGNFEVEQKISVKERMQKFNRIASECELSAVAKSSSRNRREITIKHESGDYDTASLSSFGYGFYHHVQLDPKSKEWMLVAMKCDYPILNKMAQENPALVRRKDMNGTALHWAAKHGNLECVKLLAGTYKAEVNLKSNGGYTPLHLAAQFGRQEVYDVLIKTYNADANMRDHAGKKPMQYLVRQDASLSMDSFKKLKEKRRNTEIQRERDSSFLRIGSLNVKVKSTRDAFGYLLGKSTSSSTIDRMQKNWGSADNLPEIEEHEKDKQMMPPPALSHKPSKRRQKRAADSQILKESKSDSDSDSAFGFGSDWSSPVRGD